MCRSRTAASNEQQTGDRSVRASDADRERTADVLRVQAGEGRLEPEELEERLERAFSARTLADLDPLTADLPGLRRRHERSRPRAFALPVPALLIAAIVTLAIVVHPAIWFALIPAMHLKQWSPRARTAWRGSPS
jgi:hypothetical protein